MPLTERRLVTDFVGGTFPDASPERLLAAYDDVVQVLDDPISDAICWLVQQSRHSAAKRSRAAERQAERERRQQEKFAARTATCATCGGTYERSRTDARYCSSACRQKAYRERRAA